jgi:hypothetical protein
MSIRTASVRSVLAAALLLCLGGMAGCAQPDPKPTGSPAPTATPTVSADPARTIVVGGGDFALLSESGEELDRIGYSVPPEEAIAVLTTAIGASPQRGVDGQQTCFGEYETASWEDALTLKLGDALPLPADAAFELDVTGPTAGDVRIETPQGFAVGDSIAELTASVPEAPALQFETGGALVNFDVVTGTEEDGAEPYYGAQATDLEGTGLVGGIRAPLDFRFDC